MVRIQWGYFHVDVDCPSQQFSRSVRVKEKPNFQNPQDYGLPSRSVLSLLRHDVRMSVASSHGGLSTIAGHDDGDDDDGGSVEDEDENR